MEEPFLVPQRTFQTSVLKSSSKNLSRCLKEPSKNGSLMHHFWFLKEPFKSGFFKEPFPKRVLQITYNGVQKNFKKWFFKAPFLVPQRTFQTRVLKEPFP